MLDPLHPNAAACSVCGTAIAPADLLRRGGGDQPVCRLPECRRVMRHKNLMPPSAFAHYLRNEVANVRQRREAAAAEARRLAALEASELAETGKLFDRAVRASPGLSTRNAVAVQIPTGLSRTTVLDAERIERYTSHLREMAAAAAALTSVNDITSDANLRARVTVRANSELFAARPEISKLSEKLCATCKGGCCGLGGDHAYISVMTLRAQMDANPAMSEHDVVNAYLEKLAHRTLEGACINQTPGGCALPTRMRADTCNAYFCGELAAFQETAANNPQISSVVAVQRKKPLWHRRSTDLDNPVTCVTVIEADN